MFVIEREVVVVEPAQGRYRWPPALPAPPHIAGLATEQAVADQPPAQHIATAPGEI